MWKNTVEPGQATDVNTEPAHCMLVISGYKHALTIRNTYVLPQQQWLHERASVLRYTYTAYLVLIYTG